MKLFGLSLFTTVQDRVTDGGKGAVWIKVGTTEPGTERSSAAGTEQRTDHTLDVERSEAGPQEVACAGPRPRSVLSRWFGTS